jgi:pimeloyl-ACP methyl ester carboxylesterase
LTYFQRDINITQGIAMRLAMDCRANVGVPSGSEEILVHGVRLAIAREGSGPPVLCLHAIGHGGRDYETFSLLMRDRYDVIRLDWPGQGRSGSDHEPATAVRYAALLRGVVDALQLQPPILIGCSIGGAAAIRYASENPVAGLVLANSGGLVGLTKNTQRACLLFSRIFAAGSRGAWWYKALFAQFYRSVLPAPAARDQRKRIVECAYETAPILAEAWRGFADAAQSDHRALAMALDVPVLFAWAMQDRINSFADAEPTIRQMKRTAVIKFQGGHAAFLEQPAQFAAAFDRFAREILGTRDTPANAVSAYESTLSE